jgi:hypothetical protein
MGGEDQSPVESEREDLESFGDDASELYDREVRYDAAREAEDDAQLPAEMSQPSFCAELFSFLTAANSSIGFCDGLLSLMSKHHPEKNFPRTFKGLESVVNLEMNAALGPRASLLKGLKDDVNH